MKLHTSKLGSERWGRSIGSARSRIDTDKSSGLPKLSKQDKGTQATSSLQQDLLKVKPVAIDSAVDCLRKRLGGVRLHPHGGLISRCKAEILPQIFLRSPASLCAPLSRATPPCCPITAGPRPLHRGSFCLRSLRCRVDSPRPRLVRLVVGRRRREVSHLSHRCLQCWGAVMFCRGGGGGGVVRSSSHRSTVGGSTAYEVMAGLRDQVISPESEMEGKGRYSTPTGPRRDGVLDTTAGSLG